MASVEKTLGIVLRRLREKKGLSHYKFAEFLGIDRSYYGMIERGESSPTLDKLDVLAKGLNLALSELVILVDKERKKIKGGSIVK